MKYFKGNLLDVKSGHIVHGCNAQGVMGSGVALAVKNRYPTVFHSYLAEHISSAGGLRLGRAYSVDVTDQLVIWNAITQQYFGNPGRNCSYDAIETCFNHINQSVKENERVVKEIHIPLIGAGLGGGNWKIIETIINETVDFPVSVWLIDGKMPDGTLI